MDSVVGLYEPRHSSGVAWTSEWSSDARPRTGLSAQTPAQHTLPLYITNMSHNHREASHKEDVDM